jgi:hypothetical protein
MHDVERVITLFIAAKTSDDYDTALAELYAAAPTLSEENIRRAASAMIAARVKTWPEHE